MDFRKQKQQPKTSLAARQKLQLQRGERSGIAIKGKPLLVRQRDAQVKFVDKLSYIFGEYPVWTEKADCRIAKWRHYELSFRNCIIGHHYDNYAFENAFDYVERKMDKKRKLIADLYKYAKIGDEDIMYDIEDDLHYFANCCDHFAYVKNHHALYEILPMEWDSTAEQYKLKVKQHGCDEDCDLWESDNDVEVEEEIFNTEIKEEIPEPTTYHATVQQLEQPLHYVTVEEIIEPLEVKIEEMTIEETQILEVKAEIKVEEEDLERIIQPPIPSEDYMIMLEQEERDRRMREKVKAKPDKKKTKKTKVKFVQIERSHKPYWDVKVVERQVKRENCPESQRPIEYKEMRFTSNTYAREEAIVNRYDESSIICEMYDQEPRIVHHPIAHQYHRRIADSKPQEIMLYGMQYHTEKEYNGEYNNDMHTMIEHLTRSIMSCGNQLEGYNNYKAEIIKDNNLTKPMNKGVLINLLNLGTTFGFSDKHSSMLERIQEANKPITTKAKNKMIDARNTFIVDRDWAKFLQCPGVKTICERDAVKINIKNMFLKFFRMTNIGKSCNLRTMISEVPVIIQAIETSDSESDYQDPMPDPPESTIRKKMRKFKEYIQQKAESAYASLMDKLVAGVGEALKRAGVKSYESIASAVKSAVGSCRDMIEQVLEFMKSATKKIIDGLKNTLIAIGVYDEQFDSIDFDKVLLMIVAILLVIYSDSTLVRGAGVIYILYASNLYSKVKDGLEYLKGKWEDWKNGSEEEEEEITETSCDFLTLMADWKYGVSAIICALIYTSCGITATTSERNSISSMVVNTLRNIFFAANGIAAIAKLAEVVPDLLKKIIGLFKKTEEPKKDEDLEAALRFATIVKAVAHDETINAIRLSKKSQDQITAMTSTWIKVCVYSTTEAFQKQPVGIQLYIRRAIEDFPKLRNTVYRMRQQAGFRPTTFHVQLAGNPGIGKTTLLKRLVKSLGHHYYKNIDLGSLTYTRDMSSEYWNGYANQRITLCDDVFTQNDPKQYAEMITMVNNGPTPLNMAALDDKNICFDSDFLLTTTNNMYPVVKDIFCMKAIWRRRNVLALVTCDPRVMDPSTGKLELSRFAQIKEWQKYVKKEGKFWRLTEEGEREQPHLKFTICVPAPDSGSMAVQKEDVGSNKVLYNDTDELPNGLSRPLENLDFSQFMKLVCQRYDVLRAEEKIPTKQKENVYNLMETSLFIDALLEEGVEGRLNQYESFGTTSYAKTEPQVEEAMTKAFSEFMNMAEKTTRGREPTIPKPIPQTGPILYHPKTPSPEVRAEAEAFMQATPGTSELPEEVELQEETSDVDPLLEAKRIELERRRRMADKNPRVAAANSRSGVSFSGLPDVRYTFDEATLTYYIPATGNLLMNRGAVIGTYPHVRSQVNILGPHNRMYRADFLNRIVNENDGWRFYISDLKTQLIYGFVQRNMSGDALAPYEGLWGYEDLADQFRAFAALTVEERSDLVLRGRQAYQDEEASRTFLQRSWHTLRSKCLRIWDYVKCTVRFMLNNLLLSCIALFYALYIVCVIVLMVRLISQMLLPEKIETSRVMFKAKPTTPFAIARGTASQPHDIARRVQENSVLMRIGTSHFNGLGIDGSCILTAYHSVHAYVEAGVEFKLEYKSGNVHDEWWIIDVRPEDVHIIPNSDACIIHNAQIPMFRKIKHHFYPYSAIVNKELGDHIGLHYRDEDFKMHCDSERIYSVGPMRMQTKVLGEYQTDKTLAYYGNPAIGTSGCALTMHCNYSRYSIIGIQSCKSKNGMAYAAVITQEDIESVLSKLDTNVTADDPICLETCNVTTRTRELFTDQVRFVGQVAKEKVLGVVGKTAFRKTIFAEEFPSAREPAVLNAFDPRVEVGTHPMQKSMNKYGRHVMRPLPAKALNRAVQDLTSYLRQKVKKPRVLTVEEAITGVNGSTPYNLKTSPGIPYIYEKLPGYSGKKTWIRKNEEGEITHIDPQLLEDIAKFEEEMKNGNIPSNQIYEFPKDELRSKEKVTNARSISVQDMRLNIICRMYTLDLMTQLHKLADGNFPMFVGVNPESLSWTNMYKNFSRFRNRCTDADIGNWDGHLTPQLMRAAFEVINGIYDDGPKNKRLRICVAMQIICAFVQILDLLIHTMRGQKSGTGVTAEVNTLAHTILVLALYYIAMGGTEFDSFLCFLLMVVLAIYGDDLCLAFDPRLPITPREFYNLYEYYGWPVSAADKVSALGDWKTVDDIQFLKRKFKLDHKMGSALVYAAIEPSVINDLLHWMRVTDNPKTQLYVNINEAMEFSYSHGPKFYNEMKERINVVLGRHGMDHYLVSYDEMRQCYMKRYFN